MNRRKFMRNSAWLGIGFLGLQNLKSSTTLPPFTYHKYGPLQKDPKGILDLPSGFSYQIISRTGEEMEDKLLLPGKPDGMAAFPIDQNRCLVIRNHELSPDQGPELGPFGPNYERLKYIQADWFYDYGKGTLPGAGGTTSFVYNYKKRKIERQFMSLFGTNFNCAGGATPWGSWLSCEEDMTSKGDFDGKMEKDHGYVFEVKATTKRSIQPPRPLKALGRFTHEAVCIDPESGIVYLTEDVHDGLIYRFIPNVKGNIEKGGKLQALVLKGQPTFDTRNWPENEDHMELQTKYDVEWVDLENIDPDEDALRYEGMEKGAAIFARGEGIWFDKNEFYFACTSGGRSKTGQIFRYRLSPHEGQNRESEKPAKLEIFIQPDDHELMSYCDNLTVAPWGDVLLCEDQPSPHLLGVDPRGRLYPIAFNAGFKSELAGVIVTPDNKQVLVNIQDAGLTVAIQGPWV